MALARRWAMSLPSGKHDQYADHCTCHGCLPTQRGLLDKPALTVAEVGRLMGLSRQTVTRMFQHERGVLIVGCSEKLHKSKYRSIRIPRAVYERVIGRISVK